MVRIAGLAGLLAIPLLGQIAQDRPDLCGTPDRIVPVPPNLAAFPFDGGIDLSIPLTGRTVDFRMGAVDAIQQICPLGNGRLLVFGRFNDPNGLAVYLIDAVKGVRLDRFSVRNPAVSPDQHWMALREYFPAFMESVPSEQYRLYDLTKDAAGNRFPGVNYAYVAGTGRTMYPATAKHLPFEHGSVPPQETHSFEGGSFAWAADSKALVFFDRTPQRLAAVLVTIGEDDLTTYLHPLPDETCPVSISRAEFTPSQSNAPPGVRIEFVGCPPLVLRSSEFKLAPIEVHNPIPRKPSTLVKP
ncbi:MAG TPA: hypothetical protein VGF59_20500 [Bryobacteraceae bacterium]|jgi:hypothetical protein